MPANVDLGLDLTDPESYWEALKRTVLWSVGQGTPQEHLAGVIILSMVFIASSFFTFGWTLALLVFVSLPLGIWAVLRLLNEWIRG